MLCTRNSHLFGDLIIKPRSLMHGSSFNLASVSDEYISMYVTKTIQCNYINLIVSKTLIFHIMNVIKL